MSLAARSLPATRVPTRQLLAVIRPWRGRLILIGLLVLAGALFELVPPILVRAIVDDHLAVGRRQGLLVLAALFLGATAAAQGLTFLYGYLAAAVAQSVLRTLRVRLFAHFQRLPARYFDHTPLGDAVSRCTADIDTLDTVFTSGVATLVANLFRLVTIAFAMVVLSPRLSLISALVVPPLVFVTRFLQVRVRNAERANRLAVGLMNTSLQENLRGIEVIQAFGREATFAHRFRQVLRQVVSASNRSSFYSSFYPAVTAILSSTAVAFLIWAGTRSTLGSLGISIGTLTAFALLLQRFFTPITALGDEWQTVQSALSGAERIFDVLSMPGEQVASSATLPAAMGIVCDRVVFGYLEGQPVLGGVSFQVRPGEHVALVGRTGAGKTSTIHLLAGLYAPWQGRLAISGRDPRSIADDERRRIVGIVPQATQLFSGTILENITLKDDSISQQLAMEAAELTGADPFIKRLPEGYRTRLRGAGKGLGVQLSAGQEQLLALTRALVRRPAALLLDEATAAVDGASDAAFRAALRERVLPLGTAVLTVAHRLSTAKEADRVIVMEAGAIVEEGAPALLVRAGGKFAALLELEAAGWDWQNSA
jgi:ATP-binding cassette, subfamily B, multidrug efflux pump